MWHVKIAAQNADVRCGGAVRARALPTLDLQDDSRRRTRVIEGAVGQVASVRIALDGRPRASCELEFDCAGRWIQRDFVKAVALFGKDVGWVAGVPVVHRAGDVDFAARWSIRRNRGDSDGQLGKNCQRSEEKGEECGEFRFLKTHKLVVFD